MSETSTARGTCLCGEVTFSAAQTPAEVGACHCNICRRWGGGPLMAVNCGPNVEFRHAESIKVFDSSAWADRGFCGECGTHLFYRVKQSGEYLMPVGLFAEAPEWNFDHQVFIDEKPHFYAFSNQTTDMTGPEVFAQFAPPD